MSNPEQTLNNHNYTIDLLKPKIKLKSHIPLNIDFPIRYPTSNIKPFNLMSSTEKGDDAVSWFCDLLSKPDMKSTIAEYLDTSGISNNIFDIVVRLKTDNNWCLRCIQIKLMSRAPRSINRWSVNLSGKNYPSDTLLILLNPDKTYIVMDYWKNFVEHKSPTSFEFDCNIVSYEHIKYTDIELFKKQFKNMVKNAHRIYNVREGIISNTSLAEYDSLRIIKEECDKRGIKFEYNCTTDSAIDIYLDDYSCQCKTSAYSNSQTYKLSLSKWKNGVKTPYTSHDAVEYFICQVKDNSNPLRYLRDICIVPTSILIDRGIIATETQYGSKAINLAPPNHSEYHWSESLWNNFELIKQHTTIINDPIYRFINRFNCEIKDTGTKDFGKYPVRISGINRDNPDLQYFIFFINDGEKRLYKDHIFIISKDDLINEGKVPIVPKLQRMITIAPPDFISNTKKGDWSLKYWKKISDLDNIK